MRKIRYFFETALVYFFIILSSVLTAKLRTIIGKYLGLLGLLIAKSRVQITADNLRKAFPNLDDSTLKQLVKKVFINTGITFFEILALGRLSDEEIKDYVRYKNIELIREVYNRGRGLILLSGHYGNWEFLAYSVNVYLDLPVLIIVKPFSNYFLDKVINRFRTRRGNSVVSMYESAFKVVKTLNEGGIVALLADQSATKDKDIYVPFFGREVATFDSPAFLALRYNVPIILGFAERIGNHYQVELEELDFSDLTLSKEGIYELTLRYTRKLEEAIRRRPELWLWQHRRWKHLKENGGLSDRKFL